MGIRRYMDPIERGREKNKVHKCVVKQLVLSIHIWISSLEYNGLRLEESVPEFYAFVTC